MSKNLTGEQTATITLPCQHCPNLYFKHFQDFTRHLREEHCTKEGGSFVCHYGDNGVCNSLPVEGVSDKDYLIHAMKHTTMQHQKKNNGQASGASSSWSVYSAAQNLPAVLNDPNKGKQSTFLTKTWGDSFTEKIDIPRSPYLPDITVQHLESYLGKIAKRYRKHSRINSVVNVPNFSTQEIIQNLPVRKVNPEKMKRQENSQYDLDVIPKIFFTPDLDLSKKENFNTIFPFSKDGLLNEGSNIVINVKQEQEKLTHYLDIIEVRIAEQVSSKSQAFFHAMSSHDVLMEQLTKTLDVLKAARKNICEVDSNLVQNPLQVLKYQRRRTNSTLVLEKLKLMAAVHQSQPMIQSLLSTPDYVAALDVISTTQEILVQELSGIHSFRHLGSQLLEMEKLVNKMLHTEFERYSTADLNRPLNNDSTVLDGDKLVSIILGLLRQKHFQFIDTYKEEAITTVRAVTKQRVIEALAASDCSDQQASALEVGGLSLNERLKLLDNAICSLTMLLYRIKAVQSVMKDATDLAAGLDKSNENSFVDKLLSEEDHARVIDKLNDMLTSICDYCHDRLGNLLSASSNDKDKSQFEKDTNAVDTSNKINDTYSTYDKTNWLNERATSVQVCTLAKIVDKFTNTCEHVCGKQCISLRSAFKAQAGKFVQRFHTERKTKLSHLLDSERWKQADVPPENQALITYIYKHGCFPQELSKIDKENDKISNFIYIGDEKYAVVGTALILIQTIHEYCRTARELTALSGTVGRQLAELLRHFNSRCCQLVLGAGAMQVAGLKTITSTILVLAGRSLKLVLWLMPFVKDHFQALSEETNNHSIAGMSSMSGGVALLETVERDIRSHIREIDGKILTIVENLLGAQISTWTSRPPVPSQPFRNISRHLVKLHEAVSGILPTDEVQALYRAINTSFKEKLREQLMKMNIINNGGPQHGVVTSELTFYLEALRNLKVFPAEELSNDCLDDVWSR